MADAEDPLQINLRASVEEDAFGASAGRRNRRKRVRYNDQQSFVEKGHAGIVKEDIEIPSPRPRRISTAEHILAAIMAGGERQMHGLTGRPLV